MAQVVKKLLFCKIMHVNSLVKLFVAVGISELVGILGSVFTISAIPNWYATLIKPALNPSAWVFGPVWTILYFLMGISLWLIWSSYAKASDGQRKILIKKAIGLFVVQLALNVIWSPIFFGAQSIGNALAVIILLWAAIVLTILIFKKISRTAAWLLIPYIVWVSFALYLNFAIWLLNK